MGSNLRRSILSLGERLRHGTTWILWRRKKISSLSNELTKLIKHGAWRHAPRQRKLFKAGYLGLAGCLHHHATEYYDVRKNQFVEQRNWLSWLSVVREDTNHGGGQASRPVTVYTGLAIFWRYWIQDVIES